MLENDYERLKEKLNLEEDPSQRKLIKLLSSYCELASHTQIPWWQRIWSFIFAKQNAAKLINKCLYVWGDVGRGKTMMMDLFFQRVVSKHKRRQHFHQFMSEFHKYVRTESLEQDTNHITEFVDHIASKYQLLCLDELQVNNIADAMVLYRLFSKLIEKNIFIIITSNFEPDELFKDGLQRERFLPFIELIKTKWTVYHLNNYQDYRLSSLDKMEQFYYYPLDAGAEVYLITMLSALMGAHTAHAITLRISASRFLEVARSYGKLAIFDFAELCCRAYGAEEYMAICKAFNTIIITNIPKLKETDHNEVLRFITLIDFLYEARTNLVCTAEVAIDDLYSGSKHDIEFKRTISRLHEMQSQKYINSFEYSNQVES